MCVHVVSHNRDPAHNVHLEFVNLPCLNLPGQQVHSVRLLLPHARPCEAHKEAAGPSAFFVALRRCASRASVAQSMAR